MENELFVLHDGQLVVNRIEAKKIQEYEALFRRKQIVPQDPTGTKGYVASAELYFIYLMYDVRSLYANLPQNARYENAVRDAGLPDKWKLDSVVNEAILRYQSDFKLSAAGSAYVVAERSYFNMTQDAMNMLEDIIELKLEAEAKIKKFRGSRTSKSMLSNNDKESSEFLREYMMILSDMSKVQKELAALIKTFPEQDETVRKLANKFAKEGGKMKTVVGGGELGNREE